MYERAAGTLWEPAIDYMFRVIYIYAIKERLFMIQLTTDEMFQDGGGGGGGGGGIVHV